MAKFNYKDYMKNNPLLNEAQGDNDELVYWKAHPSTSRGEHEIIWRSLVSLEGSSPTKLRWRWPWFRWVRRIPQRSAHSKPWGLRHVYKIDANSSWV